MDQLIRLFTNQSSNAVSEKKEVNGNYSFQILGDLGGGTVTIYKDDQAMTDGAFTETLDKVLSVSGTIHAELTGSTSPDCSITLKKIAQ